MIQELLDNNYKVVDMFISPEEAIALGEQLKTHYESSPASFSFDTQCKISPAIRNFYPLLELLIDKIPDMVSIVGEKLFPTYCYARLYKEGDDLAVHRDRHGCEISVTLHLSNDGVEWPIKFKTPKDEVVSVNLKPGQAVVYLGCEAPHWRESYTGTDYRQVFLHYVRARGERRWCYFDIKR